MHAACEILNLTYNSTTVETKSRSIHSKSSLRVLSTIIQRRLNIWFFTKPKTKKKAVMVEQVLSSYNYFSYEKDIKILNPNYIKTKNNFCYIRTCG